MVMTTGRQTCPVLDSFSWSCCSGRVAVPTSPGLLQETPCVGS